MSGTENAELGAKVDAIKESVDAIWDKLNRMAHVLYEGNGESVITRLRLVETRCGQNCPMAARLVVVENTVTESTRFRRTVTAGVAISAVSGVAILFMYVIGLLAKSGALP